VHDESLHREIARGAAKMFCRRSTRTKGRRFRRKRAFPMPLARAFAGAHVEVQEKTAAGSVLEDFVDARAML